MPRLRALDRKLLRDLRHLRGQMISIAAVVACGVAAVLAMGSTLQSIGAARDAYYERARFGDVFAALERAPEALASRLAAIPGVAAVQTRVAASAVLAVPGLDLPARGYLLSAPRGEGAALHALYLRRGRALDPRRNDEVLVGEHFARANDLGPGDTLGAVIGGRWRRLQIVGVALSPEFVHDMASGFAQFSDSRHFGILWMDRQALASLTGMEGAFNSVVLSLAPRASERLAIARLDRLLAPYGGSHAYGRADQPSNQVVEGEIRQLRAFGVVMPAVFLLVTAFLIGMVLSRLIATQREEIAVLKAFGYDNRRLAMHFLGYAAAAVSFGSAVGVPLGIWIGHGYTRMYDQFFRFPDLQHRTSLGLIGLAIAVNAVAAVLGALRAVRAAVALPPAEGMRPPSPPMYRPLLLEWLGLGGVLSPSARMVLRTMERRPLRTAASVAGVALAAAVLVAGIFAFDVAFYIARLQFQVVEREDIAVTFRQTRPARALHDLEAVPGVRQVEPNRVVPVRLRHGHHARELAITGLRRDAQLRRLVDIDGRIYAVPPAGLVLTTTLARTLEVRPGDTVRVSITERGGVDRQAVVVALLDEMLGIGAYMDLQQLNRLVGEGAIVSGAYVALEPGTEPSVTSALAAMPGIAGATPIHVMRERFEEMISSNITMTTTIITTLAAVIAIGVLYNGARIALSERGRELASLRVLGFTRREIGVLLLGEQAVVNIAGTPLGLLLGLGLAHLIALGFHSELYRFPVIVTARTYLAAVGVVLAASVIAGLAMRRRLGGLDLIAVLKTRE